MQPHVEPIYKKYRALGIRALTETEVNFLYMEVMLFGGVPKEEKSEIRQFY